MKKWECLWDMTPTWLIIRLFTHCTDPVTFGINLLLVIRGSCWQWRGNIDLSAALSFNVMLWIVLLPVAKRPEGPPRAQSGQRAQQQKPAAVLMGQVVAAVKVARWDWEKPNEVLFTNEVKAFLSLCRSLSQLQQCYRYAPHSASSQQLQGFCLKHSNSAKTLLKYHECTSSQFQHFAFRMEQN